MQSRHDVCDGIGSISPPEVSDLLAAVEDNSPARMTLASAG
jgi:hypothetical protein